MGSLGAIFITTGVEIGYYLKGLFQKKNLEHVSLPGQFGQTKIVNFAINNIIALSEEVGSKSFDLPAVLIIFKEYVNRMCKKDHVSIRWNHTYLYDDCNPTHDTIGHRCVFATTFSPVPGITRLELSENSSIDTRDMLKIEAVNLVWLVKFRGKPNIFMLEEVKHSPLPYTEQFVHDPQNLSAPVKPEIPLFMYKASSMKLTKPLKKGEKMPILKKCPPRSHHKNIYHCVKCKETFPNQLVKNFKFSKNIFITFKDDSPEQSCTSGMN